MAHDISELGEKYLDTELKCLDKGFVRMVDYNGTDARVVQSARVSYGAGTKSIREDKGLIDYLWRNRHTSPFEQVQFTFHCKMPIFVARQWVRHRTARLNEVSGRYSIMKDEFYVPEPEHICYQATDNKQGRSGPVGADDAHEYQVEMTLEQKTSYSQYEQRVNEGLAKELARINLPLSLYTEWYWSIDLHNLLHFLELRLDGHAQYEIRVYAEAMAECVKAVAPWSWAAFEEHTLNAIRFSKTELELLDRCLDIGRVNELTCLVGVSDKQMAAFQVKMKKAFDIIQTSK